MFGKEMPEDASRYPKLTISPNLLRHSRKSVSDGVIQLRVSLAGCPETARTQALSLETKRVFLGKTTAKLHRF